MKKAVMWIAALVCIGGMSGCRKTVDASAVYGFPEPTIQVTVSLWSQGTERTAVIGPEAYDPDNPYELPVIGWFYGLELQECEEPEPVEGEERYAFSPDGRPGFDYVDRGSEAFVVADDEWYQVTNPSDPPLAWEDGADLFEGSKTCSACRKSASTR